jgi:shikimate 5-dehydrogenase
MDFALHDRPNAYREAVAFIKNDPLSRGALITTHKIDLLEASADLFDALDAFARAQREVSCLSKRNGRLIGHAKDPISARLALDAIVPPHHWQRTGAEVLAIGAGGATTAITWNLMRPEHGENRPARIVVSDINPQRLDALRRFHAGLQSPVAVDYVEAGSAEQNDALLSALAPASLVINATGLGKDRPGSPLAGAGEFPIDALVWELNYRGDLVFLAQADAQAQRRRLRITDGWNYFLHGWTQVIAEVFDVEIPSAGSRFERLSELAGGAPRLRAAAQP